MMNTRWQRKDPAPIRPDLALASLFADWRAWLPQALLIIASSLWIYGPALHGDWVWDDDRYVTDNPLLRSIQGLGIIWLQPGATVDYYPLEATVTWLQWHLWGLHRFGYHLTNVILHIVSALLVWRLLSKFKLRLAWLGGLLFAIHPVQVESVAWVAELKNTLSLPLLLGSMCLYLDFDAGTRPRGYGPALALFVAALLCKLSVVFFPFVILLYVWWKRDRISRDDLKASAPFFAAALAVGLISILSGVWANQFDPQKASLIPAGGMLGRMDLAGLAFSFYFSKVFLPIDLLTVYPSWPIDYTALWQYLPWPVFAAALFWCWTQRHGWGRHALLGLGFFIINLAPCPGFIPAPNMSYAWVMDHFLYLPIIGFIGLFVASLRQVPSAFRPLSIAVMVPLMAWLGWQSHVYAGNYRDSKTLWTYTLARNPAAWPGLVNIASIAIDQQRYTEAIPKLQQALRLRPVNSDAHYDLGLALEALGQKDEAQKEYREAFRLTPGYADAYMHLGEMLLKEGDSTQAEALYRQGLQNAPHDSALCVNLGGLLMKQGATAEAIELYERALKTSPDLAQLQYDLGVALLGQGKLPDAADHLATAVKLTPTFPAAHENLGVTLAQLHQLPEAIEQFQAVIELDPKSVAARNNLALALAQTGHIAEAIDQFGQVLQIDPNNLKAQDSLAKLRQFQAQHPAPGGP